MFPHSRQHNTSPCTMLTCVCIPAGRVKKPTAAATKQWARQARRHQQAQEQGSDDSPQPSAQQTAGPSQRSKQSQPHHNSATRTLLAAIHRQDKADKYIDRILRKQGGRLHKAKPLAAPSGSLQPARGNHKGSQRQRLHANDGVMAELQALNRQQQPADEDMYESEQDHYFTDDED